MKPNHKAKRILRYLKENKIRDFRAADIAVALNLTPAAVGGILHGIPEINVAARRKFARRESGTLWRAPV